MRINARPKLRQLFRLRTILMVVMLSVLFLPLVSVFFFRVYENELLQKTELELISQSAVLAASYRHFLGKEDYPAVPDLVNAAPYSRTTQPDFYMPIVAALDLSTQKTLPRRSDALPTKLSASAQAIQAGQQMQSIIINSQRITLAGMRILDPQGIVIAGRYELGKSLAHLPEVQHALKGNYSSVIRQRISDEPTPPIASLSRGTNIRVFTATPILNNQEVLGVVYLSRTPQNILKHIYHIKEKVGLLVLLILSITFGMVLFISSRLSRPIRELTQQAKQLANGEVDTIKVLHQPGTYELAELSTSFAKMSNTLHERSTYIRQFASHVSHEFKTPLTGIQGALELLSDHNDSMTAEQRQKFINNIQEDTQRLKNLVNRMLEFAHADALNPSIDATDLIAHIKNLQSLYHDKDLLVTLPEKSEVLINIAPEALDSVICNLFDNARHHGASKVAMDIQQNSQHTLLTISDNGKGISPANRQKIFTPFFTTRRDTGGTGLGLGIVESLLENWQGSIECIPSDEGASFIITFMNSVNKLTSRTK